MGQEKDYFRERRRTLRRTRWSERMARAMQYALIAEAFLIPLVPLAAMAVLLVGCAALCVRLRIDPDFHLRRLPYDAPALLFVVIAFLSVAVAPDMAFSFYNYSHLVPIYALTYLLTGQALRSAEELRPVVIAMAAAAVFVILYGFYQFIFGIDISAMKWVDGASFPELSKRVFSTWENPNILAGYLDIVVCLALGLAARPLAHDSRPRARVPRHDLRAWRMPRDRRHLGGLWRPARLARPPRHRRHRRGHSLLRPRALGSSALRLYAD